MGDRQGVHEQGRRGRYLRQIRCESRCSTPPSSGWPPISSATWRPFETVIGSSKIQFTPQKKFFDTTQNWAVALQDIYGGDDAASRLRSLAKTNTSKVNL